MLSYQWGPIYTLYDTLIDVYVTVVISYILLSHIRSLVSDRMQVNNNLYVSVIYHNVIRTVCLTIVNLISTTLIVMVHYFERNSGFMSTNASYFVERPS